MFVTYPHVQMKRKADPSTFRGPAFKKRPSEWQRLVNKHTGLSASICSIIDEYARICCESCDSAKKDDVKAPAQGRSERQAWDFVRCDKCTTTFCVGCHNILMSQTIRHVTYDKAVFQTSPVCYACDPGASDRVCDYCQNTGLDWRDIPLIRYHSSCGKFFCRTCFPASVHECDQCELLE